MTGELIRASKTTAIRYERDLPADLVHMDVKKLGRIPVGGGWRALGRAEGHHDRNVKIGYDYGHSVVDDHSRLATARSWAMRKARPARPSCPGPWTPSPPRGSPWCTG